jgi:hypothetical protein
MPFVPPAHETFVEEARFTTTWAFMEKLMMRNNNINGIDALE